MAKIPRVFQKLFGSSGNVSDFGQPGSFDTTKTNTKDPATIQGLSAFLDGLASIVPSGTYKIANEDFNSLLLLIFYQICYLMQAGIPEYDDSTTYYIGSYCQVSGVIYVSLTDNNTGNTPSSSPTNWQIQQYVDLTTAQTVAGVKTFSSSPIIPAPTTDLQAATKKYVDDNKTALGALTDKSSSYGNQVAATDGYVVVMAATNAGGSVEVKGFTDSSATPTNQICGAKDRDDGWTGHPGRCGFTMPVKKGNGWRVEVVYEISGTIKVSWIPSGA